MKGLVLVMVEVIQGSALFSSCTIKLMKDNSKGWDADFVLVHFVHPVSVPKSPASCVLLFINFILLSVPKPPPSCVAVRPVMQAEALVFYTGSFMYPALISFPACKLS